MSKMNEESLKQQTAARAAANKQEAAKATANRDPAYKEPAQEDLADMAASLAATPQAAAGNGAVSADLQPKQAEVITYELPPETQAPDVQAVENNFAPIIHDVIAATEQYKSPFTDIDKFEEYQRMAKMLAASTMVPKEYQGNIGNCVIAMELADRMGASPMMVMQNLYVVHGKPGWSGQFIAALINTSGRFTPLQYKITEDAVAKEYTGTIYEWRNENGKNVKRPKQVSVTLKNKTVIAYAKSLKTGEVLASAPVSMELAVAEGWYHKDGSKWQTPLADIMLMYRAAAFFGRVHCSDRLMGMQTVEEIKDVNDEYTGGTASNDEPDTVAQLNAVIEQKKAVL